MTAALLLGASSGTAFKAPPIEPPQSFSGSGERMDLGSITVQNESVLTWNCPGCGESDFFINDKEYELSVIEENKTSGQIAVKPGTYNDVTIETCCGESHTWTFTVTPIERRLPITSIQVATRSHHGRTYRFPGYTAVEVGTAPEAAAFMTIDFWRGKRHLGQRWWAPPYAPKELQEARVYAFPWACQDPGAVIRYTARARGDTGATVSASGQFRFNVSSLWCKSAKKRQEAADRRRSEQEARIRREEREETDRHNRERTEREHAEYQRFEANCRALGGTPVTLHLSSGPVRVCRGPNGGLIPVPT